MSLAAEMHDRIGTVDLARKLLIRLALELETERERWPLWLAVGLGLGVAFYFALPLEPPAWAGALLLTLGCGSLLLLKDRPLGLFGGLLALALALGFAGAELRARLVAAPVLERPVRMAMVEGEVIEVEPLSAGQRVTLERPRIERQGVPDLERVRIRLPAGAPIPMPGDRIRLRATVMPPAEPALPGGFDFARQAWFERLGGVGYAVGRVEIKPPEGEIGLVRKARLWLSGLRQAITARVLQTLPGDTGAVAAALMTGGDKAVSKGLLEAYRDSGLAHILSISGLHMSMVAGLIFFVVRGLLALIPRLALNHPIKKWTALIAMAATFFYLLISGAFVPTQRSFLMILLVLIGVVLDRQAISMRLVAWAAAAILLVQPESLLGASFQMSFAAVVALIAAYEAGRGRVGAWRGQGGWWRLVVLYVAGTAFTSLIAGLATAPFSLAHFNRVNPFGLVSNLIAVPLTGIWVMPWELMAFLLMPLGLERLALIPMGWGVDLMNWIARAVASWPGAGLAAASPPDWGFAALILGGLWLCLWRRPWRLAGLAGIALGLISLPMARPADFLIEGRNDLMAARVADGRLMLSHDKGGLTAEVWQRRNASGQEPGRLADRRAADFACDRLGCVVEARGKTVLLAFRPDILVEECARADLVLATFLVSARACKGPQLIDRRALSRQGAHAIWIERDGIRVETVARERGQRRWVPGSKRPKMASPV
ncbi:MAG: ComEC/Rec2 family competence protein [Rhodospirillales bacterium]|nr:ComEC/Rec2 family competence protein [Rhodospirillales bacterium]